MNDIGNIIKSLDGDKNRDVIQWFHDLDRIYLLLRVRETDKILFTFRLLAAVIARTSKADTSDELERELINNLHIAPTVDSSTDGTVVRLTVGLYNIDNQDIRLISQK